MICGGMTATMAVLPLWIGLGLPTGVVVRGGCAPGPLDVLGWRDWST